MDEYQMHYSVREGRLKRQYILWFHLIWYISGKGKIIQTKWDHFLSWTGAGGKADCK